MDRIGWHLTWPRLDDELRAARQDLEDDDWNNRDTQPAKARVAALEAEQRVGVRYVPPF